MKLALSFLKKKNKKVKVNHISMCGDEEAVWRRKVQVLSRGRIWADQRKWNER